jgi:hypothetical protein
MMVVGVGKVTLMVSDSHSLKAKRMVLRRIKDRCRNKFNVAIAEVGSQDLWQTAELGFSVVGNDYVFVQQMVDTIVTFIDDLAVAKMIRDDKDFITYGDEVG